MSIQPAGCCCGGWYEILPCQICVQKQLQPSSPFPTFPYGYYVRKQWVDEHPLLVQQVVDRLVFRVWIDTSWEWQCYCFEVGPGNPLVTVLPDGAQEVTDPAFHLAFGTEMCGLDPPTQGTPPDSDLNCPLASTGVWIFCLDGCAGCCPTDCCGIGRADECCCYEVGQTADWTQNFNQASNCAVCSNDVDMCCTYYSPQFNSGTAVCTGCDDSTAVFTLDPANICRPFETLCFGITIPPAGCGGTTGHWIGPEEGCTVYHGDAGACVPYAHDDCDWESYSDPNLPLCCLFPSVQECEHILADPVVEAGCYTLLKDCYQNTRPEKGGPTAPCEMHLIGQFTFVVEPPLTCIYCAETIYGYRECVPSPDMSEICP